MKEPGNEAPAAPLSYFATTRSGTKWRIDIAQDGLAVGETMRGTVTLEGEQPPQPSAGSAELVAQGRRKDTSLDLGGLAANAMGLPDEEGERDPIPTKEKIISWRITAISAPIDVAAGQPSWPFQLAIPLDAPPSVRANGVNVTWNLRVSITTATGTEVVSVARLPIVLRANRIAATPNLEPGAIEPVVSGNAKGVDWRIEIDELPLVAAGTYRGTLVMSVSEALQKRRPGVRIQGESRGPGSEYGLGEWSERGKIISDDLDGDGRRRIVFEGSVPQGACVTTAAGDTKIVASIGVSLLRWGIFGPEFKRPVAVASAT